MVVAVVAALVGEGSADRRILLYPGARTEASSFLVGQLLLADSGAANVSSSRRHGIAPARRRIVGWST